jgi:hypothetical protein
LPGTINYEAIGTHPTENKWALADNFHLYLFTLEGAKEKGWFSMISPRNVLARSENFMVGYEYENAYLVSDRLAHRGGAVYLGDFYGDPYVALIDKEEKWCAVGGCGLVVYRIEEPFPNVDKHRPSTQWAFIEHRQPDRESLKQGTLEQDLWVDSLAQVGPSDLEIITKDDETYIFSLPKGDEIMPSLLQEPASGHTGVVLSQQAFESFFRAIEPFCWRIHRKRGVILSESDEFKVREIQLFYIEKLLSYQEAEGFIWVTGAVGKELREKLMSAASVEDSSDRRLAIDLLRDVENNGDECITSFELQPDSI